MAPDYISELALLSISRWQRQAWEKMMWRKDIQDTISGCEYFETPFDLYLMGYLEPHYPVPMLRHPDIDRPLYYWYRVTTILLYFRFHRPE